MEEALGDETKNDESVELASSVSLVEERVTVVEELQTGDDNEEADHGNLRVSAMSRLFKLSNGFFFMGSVIYVGTGIFGVIESYQDYDEGDNDDSLLPSDDETGDGDDESLSFWTAYKVLASAAALMYLGNAFVDGRVAIIEIQGKVGSGRFGDDPRWEIGVAVTFGVAALSDFISELIWEDDNMWPGYAAGCAAVDFYLLNAVLVSLGRTPAFTTVPHTLTSAGDILFFIGSIIDVLISFVNNPKAPSSRSIEIAWSSLVSAVLWFLDSLLYIFANHLSHDDDYYVVESDESESSDELEISSTVVPMSPESDHNDGNDVTDLRLHRRRHKSPKMDQTEETEAIQN